MESRWPIPQLAQSSSMVLIELTLFVGKAPCAVDGILELLTETIC